MNSSVLASSAHDWLDVSIGSVAKFFAKAAPGRKLAGDQWPIRIRRA
jgi:hypothetical protein